MITDSILDEYVAGSDGAALVWIIDGDCLYDIPVDIKYVPMFTESDELVDVSDQYPEHDGLTVRFMKNGDIIEDLQTTEYFGSILLSEPQVVDLEKYPYGRYVQSPYAKFDGEKFIITNRDMTGYPEWYE